MTKRTALACVILATCALPILPAGAQISSRTGVGNPSPTADAAKQVREAELAVRKAQAEVTRIKNHTRAQFMTKAEWKPVTANLKKAEANLAATERAVLSGVHAKPEYKKFMDDREEARKIRDASQSGTAATDSLSGPDAAAISKAQDRFSSDTIEMKKMERQALADDPKYNEAKSQLEAAKAKSAELDSQVEDSLKNEQDYSAAVQAVEQAQAQVVQSKQQLAQVRQQEEQQRISEAKSRSQSHGSGYGGR